MGSPALSMKSADPRFQVTEFPAENGTAALVGGPGSPRLRENHRGSPALSMKADGLGLLAVEKSLEKKDASAS
jgi:hypothetical protein